MPLQNNEPLRLKALQQLAILDTPESEAFDRITRLASRLFDVPIALVTLVDADRQWFKSSYGLDARETPREQAFCDHTIRSRNIMVVPDASTDPRFSANPLVTGNPNIRFYAGAPLISDDGFGLGSLCLIDSKPREMSLEDQQVLMDLSAMVMAQINLHHAIGRVDPFSGLPNRNKLFEDLEDLIDRNVDQQYIVMVADLLSPGKLDDLMHAVGPAYVDQLIHDAAQKAKQALGNEMTLYHLDNARYACVALDDDMRSVRNLTKTMTDCFAAPMSCGRIPAEMDLVLGFSRLMPGVADPGDMVRSAIAAAMEARHSRRGWSLYNEESDRARKRAITLLGDFRQAINRPGELRLVYQPKFDVAAGRCESAEALIRWTHPLLGVISPAEFIPLVEQTALAEPLTDWVMQTAIDQVSAWAAQGIKLNVAVNVSARNLEEPDFADRLARRMAAQSIRPDMLHLEFTESAVMQNQGMALTQLHKIRSLGVIIAIDDFGSGYSNHAYLQKIPANIVKIDQSLIRNTDKNAKDRMITEHLISMFHSLGYRVVAEGVETPEIFDWLVRAGCDLIQGYVISRPIEAGEIPAFLERQVKGTGTSGAGRQV